MNSRVHDQKNCGCWEVYETIIRDLRFAVGDASFLNGFFMVIIEDCRLEVFETQLN